MPLIQTVTVDDRTIDLHTFQGEVVEEKKWTSTHVSGSGGGYNVGSGHQNPVTISSSTSTHDQFFLRDNEGREMAVEITDAGVALRKGHRVTVLWGIPRGADRGPFLAVYNHTTGNVNRLDANIRSLVVPPTPMLVTLGYLVGVFAICFYGVGFVILGILFYVRSQRKKRWQTTFRSAVDAAIAGIK